MSRASKAACDGDPVAPRPSTPPPRPAAGAAKRDSADAALGPPRFRVSGFFAGSVKRHRRGYLAPKEQAEDERAAALAKRVTIVEETSAEARLAQQPAAAEDGVGGADARGCAEDA